MKGYNLIRKRILDILNNNLSKDLHYHGVHHTLDALKTCDIYLQHIKVDKKQAQLLRLGILLHDIGFTQTIAEHEKKSAEIARDLLEEYETPKEDIETIIGLILATKIPQQPKTLLEKIICDIDLDYLGRSDFYRISDQLYRELRELSDLKNKHEWNKIQIKFLESHQYHTDFAKKNRQPEKEKRIQELKEAVGN